jgi:hypothetical protein
MYSGRRARRNVRRSWAGTGSRETIQAERLCSPGLTITTARSTAAWLSSATSISPSSMRKPRTFTW